MHAKALVLMTTLIATGAAFAEERQITFTPKNHHLDNNDNFSADGRFLVYDTRGTLGPGLDNCQSIEKVEISTGEETVLYAPRVAITAFGPVPGAGAAPGMGAVGYNPVADEVIFILGPEVEEIGERGAYGIPNRQGAIVPADGSGTVRWADKRDIAADRDTTPGAHRGGSHRHEFTLDGSRIGFTYDDFLLPQYGRTIAYLEPHPDAPAPATHYFALLVPVVPKGTAKPGEIERAAGDSWIGRDGRMRAFIGTVRNEDGETYEDSLFVVDIPDGVDITTADAGSATHFPAPPEGVRVRRLTQSWAKGIARGTAAGDRIAYFAKAPDGSTQVFVIPSDGAEDDPEKGPVQVTHLEQGTESNLRWHPSGNTILSVSDGGIVATCVKEGDPRFGKSVFLTPHGDGEARGELVISPDGATLAWCRAVPTQNADGSPAKTYDGGDFTQIFVRDFPDANGDGIPDGL